MAKKAKKEAKQSVEITPVEGDRIALEVAKQSKFKEKPSEQIIENVITDLEALIVQRGKEAREFTMMIFWETGKTLREAEQHNKVSITALVVRVAADNRIAGRQMGERNLWFAIRFYDKFKDFEDVYDTEFGENVSLSKIKKMLVSPRPKKNKTLQQVAYDLVDKYGADGAQTLIVEIEAEIKRRFSEK